MEMEVKARAPGKIILSGEHAVVHGSTAVAASIDLCTHVSLKFPSHLGNKDILVLQLKDIALEFSWPLEILKRVLPDVVDRPFSSTPTSCSAESIKCLESLIDEQSFPEAGVGLASGVHAFLWLYISILGFKPATVVITSQLPVGAGLGSSAAFCVALSAALLAASDSVTLNADERGWLALEDIHLELLNKWAFEGERIIHGKPSGIDNTVSTFGDMIRFKFPNILTRIKPNMPLKMLITNTKVGRNTKALVAGVSGRTFRHPEAMASVFSAVDFISNELAATIQCPATGDLSVSEKEEKLGELMEMNQGLLQCMGVSHASIETILRTTLKYKLASKLTGAGGGGCVVTLLPTSLSDAIVNKVAAELESCGYQCMTAEIGGKGVQVSYSVPS